MPVSESEGLGVKKMHTYIIIKEDFFTGIRGKRKKTICKNQTLKVGVLYMHLGNGLKVCWRVLEEKNEPQGGNP